jgi:hypothetical protein
LNEDLAILTNLLEPDGSPVLHANQKVVMFLAGIEPIDSAQGGLGAKTKGHTHGASFDLVEVAPFHRTL